MLRRLLAIVLLTLSFLPGCAAEIGPPDEASEVDLALAAAPDCASHCSRTCNDPQFPTLHTEDNCEIRGGVCKGSWRCWCESSLGRKQRGSDQSGRCDGGTCAVIDEDSAEPDLADDLLYCAPTDDAAAEPL